MKAASQRRTGHPAVTAVITIDGTDAGNYTVTDTDTATDQASITAKQLTGSFTASDKVWGGTTAATITSRSVSGVVEGEVVELTGGTATFDDAHVGIGKTVTGTGFALDGADEANYTGVLPDQEAANRPPADPRPPGRGSAAVPSPSTVRLVNRLHVAQRANVPPFHVMDLLAAATARQASHGDLVNFVAGQPSTGAPRAVREEAKRLLDEDVLGYTVATGIFPLRAAIAQHHRNASGIEVTADDVVVTTGSSGGFLLAFLSAFNPGDRVVMARPGYPCYRNVLTALGCEVVEVDCGHETRFQPTVELLESVEGPVHGLVIASPANPTGTMVEPDELAAIARWCEQSGVRLISDEIYHGITYGVPTSSAWETSRTGIVFGSLSKYFSMTGWRLGWMLVPEDLRRPVDVLTGNFTICPPVLSQYAAVAAFTPESYAELDGHVARYRDNRDVLLKRLPELGIDKLAPADGAFYAYADIGHLTDDSYAWCLRLLEQTGVATAPGIDFDTWHGNRFVRFSFAGSEAEIHEGLDRLARWL